MLYTVSTKMTCIAHHQCKTIMKANLNKSLKNGSELSVIGNFYLIKYVKYFHIKLLDFQL